MVDTLAGAKRTELLSLNTLLLVIGLYIVYQIASTIYSVYLGPLSKFPGPKLAAATQWYETYYELYYRGGGQFTAHIKEIHDRYGPIVRISPQEIHISDPEYYETIYAPSTPSSKRLCLENRLGMPGATFSTASHSRHRLRRAAVAPFFTKSKVQTYSPFVQEVVDAICLRLSLEYRDRGRPVPLHFVFAALAGDVIKSLAFGEEMSISRAEGFVTPWVLGCKALATSVHPMTQFPILPWIVDRIPKKWLLKDKNMGPVVEFNMYLESRVGEVLDRRARGDKLTGNTVFEVLLHSDLPASELTQSRLAHESCSIVAAGFETTRQTLCVIAYHILANPSIHSRLYTELITAIPDASKMLPWEEMQKLPYLSAVVQEGLRIGVPVSQRSPRIFQTPMTYGSWVIPSGTPISNDTYHMHNDPSIYPQPLDFIPDRWLSDPTTGKAPTGPDGVKQLDRYQTAFGRGARMCLGMQIATCELFLMTASLFRRFGGEGKMELYDTDRSDVDFYADYVVPMPKPESNGVRVLLKE